MTQLSRKQRLRTLEKEIRSGMEEFYYTGMKLKEIRDDELYKEDGFATWEQYCRERWEWSARHVTRLITASEYREKLPDNGSDRTKWSEGSIRELTRIPDKKQAARVAAYIPLHTLFALDSRLSTAESRKQRPSYEARRQDQLHPVTHDLRFRLSTLDFSTGVAANPAVESIGGRNFVVEDGAETAITTAGDGAECNRFEQFGPTADDLVFRLSDRQVRRLGRDADPLTLPVAPEHQHTKGKLLTHSWMMPHGHPQGNLNRVLRRPSRCDERPEFQIR